MARAGELDKRAADAATDTEREAFAAAADAHRRVADSAQEFAEHLRAEAKAHAGSPRRLSLAC